MSDLAMHFARLNYRIAELERRGRNRSHIGTVKEVDPVKGQARVELANGFVTGWIPWQEQAAGSARTHFPLSIGQQVRIRSQNGDLTDAEIEVSLPSDANIRPSQKGNEYVLLEVGNARITVSDGGATASITVGGSTLMITDGTMTLEAVEITLKGLSKWRAHPSPITVQTLVTRISMAVSWPDLQLQAFRQIRLILKASFSASQWRK